MFELNLDEATPEKLDEVLAFTDRILKDLECPTSIKKLLDMAVEEAYVNIVHYAYAPGMGPASIRVETEPNRIVAVTLIDMGMPYNPLAKPDPDITLSVKERPIGGLGIYMVKSSMDDVKYRRDGNSNVLTIRKRY